MGVRQFWAQSEAEMGTLRLLQEDDQAFLDKREEEYQAYLDQDGVFDGSIFTTCVKQGTVRTIPLSSP